MNATTRSSSRSTATRARRTSMARLQLFLVLFAEPADEANSISGRSRRAGR